MVKVDTLCTCLRLAPVGLLLAVHCSNGHWPTDGEAGDRALRYGFSIRLLSERPLSILTHMLVHVSTEHLLSNIFSLSSTLLEFGGEGTMRENVEEDELPVVAERTIGSFIVMLVGGIVGGIGGQVLYNDRKVSERMEQADRISAEKQRLSHTHARSSPSSSDSPQGRGRKILGEPRAGMSAVRKPNMARLWTDEGSVVARNIIENASTQRFRQRQDKGAVNSTTTTGGECSGSSGASGGVSSAANGGLPTSSRATATSAATRSSNLATPVTAKASPSPAEAYTAAMRVRVVYKMRGSIDVDEVGCDGDGDCDGDGYSGDAVSTSMGGNGGRVGSLTASARSGLNIDGGESSNVISRALAKARLSLQLWSTTKAAQAQALINRSMLMCGASAGVCALSGFNATYYRRPATALCLAVPEVLVLAHELYLSRYASGESSATSSSSFASTWRTLMPGQTVGHAAHVGGFIVGCAMGLVWRQVSPLSAERGRRRREEKRRRRREAEDRASAEQWHARPSPMNRNPSNS